MVDIATLGIKVDSSGAEKGVAVVEKLSTVSKDATKSTDQLTAATVKQSAALNSNSSRIEQQARQNAALSDSAHKAGAAHSDLAHQVHGVEAGLKATGLAAITHAMGFGAISSQTVNAAKQFENFEFKSSQLRTGLRVLRPLAVEAGASLGNLGMLAGAGRAGMGVLAAVITGTVLIALEKAVDNVRVLEGRFKSLFGASTGSTAFHELEGVAKRTGVAMSGLAGAFEELAKAEQESMFNRGWRFTPGAQALEITKMTEAAETLTKMFLISGRDVDEAAKGIEAFFKNAIAATDEFGKKGFLTRQIFEQLEKEAPRAAEALAKAFGGGDAVRLKQNLELLPKPISEVIRLLKTLGPETAEEFAKTPKTIVQNLGSLKTDFEMLMEDVGKSGGLKFATNFIEGARNIIKNGITWGTWADVFSWMNEAPPDNLIAQASTAVREAVKKIIKDAWAGAWDFLTVPKTPDSGDMADKFPRTGQGLPKALQAVEESETKLATASELTATKITTAAQSITAGMAMLDAAGNALYSGPDDYGNSTGITAGSVSVGDTNVTGGIYKMPSGGTADSLRLTGKVSPGETVAIIPEDKMSGSLLAQLHDTIGSSPINVGPGGSSYISAPASYTDAEARRGKLAMDITAAQQAEARARIAANVAATSSGTSSASTSTSNSMQTLLNMKGLGGGVGGGHTFKPTSKPLWFDQDPFPAGASTGYSEPYVDKQAAKPPEKKTPSTTFIGNPYTNIGPEQEGAGGGRDLREKLSFGDGDKREKLSFGGGDLREALSLGGTWEDFLKAQTDMLAAAGQQWNGIVPFVGGNPMTGNFPQYGEQQPVNNFPQYGGNGGIGSDYVATNAPGPDEYPFYGPFPDQGGPNPWEQPGRGIGSDYVAGGGLMGAVGGVGSDYASSGGVGADTPYYMTLPDYTGGYADPQRFGIGAGRNNQMPYSGPDDYLSPDDYVDAGAFARGGSFTVPNRGRGGVDGTSVRMNVTPGEQVSVSPNGEQIGGSKGGGGGTHIENVYVVTQGENPMASLSRNAIRRELSAWTR